MSLIYFDQKARSLIDEIAHRSWTFKEFSHFMNHCYVRYPGIQPLPPYGWYYQGYELELSDIHEARETCALLARCEQEGGYVTLPSPILTHPISGFIWPDDVILVVKHKNAGIAPLRAAVERRRVITEQAVQSFVDDMTRLAHTGVYHIDAAAGADRWTVYQPSARLTLVRWTHLRPNKYTHRATYLDRLHRHANGLLERKVHSPNLFG